MNSRDDIVTENGLCPLVALRTSDAVEAAAQKNALTFADLLAPFCSAQTSIKVTLLAITWSTHNFRLGSKRTADLYKVTRGCSEHSAERVSAQSHRSAECASRGK